MATTGAKKCIIKNSKQIRTFLLKRMNELGLKPTDIIKDANERGIKMDNASWSKFMVHNDAKGGLSQETIIWLSTRWGINIHLLVGTPKLVDGKLIVYLPAYNEKEALAKLEKLKLIFA